jgi:hypothetical protein
MTLSSVLLSSRHPCLFGFASVSLSLRLQSQSSFPMRLLPALDTLILPSSVGREWPRFDVGCGGPGDGHCCGAGHLEPPGCCAAGGAPPVHGGNSGRLGVRDCQCAPRGGGHHPSHARDGGQGGEGQPDRCPESMSAKNSKNFKTF